MGDLQDRVFAVVDDIDDFLQRVRKSAEKNDTGEMDILGLRGKAILSYAEKLEEETEAEIINADSGDHLHKNVLMQLKSVLRMETDGLRATLRAVEGADAVKTVIEETEKAAGMKEFREALWKETIKK